MEQAFIGVEAGALAGVSNTGAGVNANAFAGARAAGKVGTQVGPVDGAARGEAWAGVGAEPERKRLSKCVRRASHENRKQH